MKRDMDLLRSILILAEDQPAGELVRDFTSLGADHQIVVEHVWLAKTAGLLEAEFAGDSPDHGAAVIVRLTSTGHDFLAQAREPALWKTAKDTASKAGVGATVDVMKTILSHLAVAAINTTMARLG